MSKRMPPGTLFSKPGDPVLVGRGGGNDAADYMSSLSDTYYPLASPVVRNLPKGEWTVRQGEQVVLQLVGALMAEGGTSKSVLAGTALAGMTMNAMRNVACEYGCVLEIDFSSADLDSLDMTITVRRNDGKERD